MLVFTYNTGLSHEWLGLNVKIIGKKAKRFATCRKPKVGANDAGEFIRYYSPWMGDSVGGANDAGELIRYYSPWKGDDVGGANDAGEFIRHYSP